MPESEMLWLDLLRPGAVISKETETFDAAE